MNENKELDQEELKQIAEVLNINGFKILEKHLHARCDERDKLSLISENTFENGITVGIVSGMKIMFNEIENIRQEIKKMEKENG